MTGRDKLSLMYAKNKMPETPATRRAAAFFKRIRETERYKFARSCKHCTDTADSFNQYISTYCHLKQIHIAGFGKDDLESCRNCEYYEKRDKR